MLRSIFLIPVFQRPIPGRTVYQVLNGSAGNQIFDIACRNLNYSVVSLSQMIESGDMRRDHNAGTFPKRMLLWQRLRIGDIYPCKDTPFLKHINKCFGIDCVPPAYIQQYSAFFHAA